MITPAVDCSYPLAEAIRSFVEERPQGKASITIAAQNTTKEQHS